MMYPIRFTPVYRSAPWSASWKGEHLADLPHHAPPKKGCCESWELFDFEEESSIVENGKWKGKSLKELTLELGEELIGVGHHLLPKTPFPLSIKILDAGRDPPFFLLPIHKKEGPFPSEKLWIALAPSTVGSGFSSSLDEVEFLKEWKKGKGEELLEKVELKKGAPLFIPEGRVHLLFQGGFVFEVAPTIDPTAPLTFPKKGHLPPIDWEGRGELNVAHGVAETDFSHRIILLGSTPLFIADRVEVYREWELPHHKRSFHLLFCTGGKGEIDGEVIEGGQLYLIPAAAERAMVRGRVDLLWIRLAFEKEPKHALL